MAKNEAKKEKEKKKHKKYEEQVASACCCREFATICYTVSLRFSTQDSGLGHGAQQWTVNTPPVRPAPALLELCRSWRCDCDVWHQILRLKTAAGVIAWFSHFPHFHLSFPWRSHTLVKCSRKRVSVTLCYDIIYYRIIYDIKYIFMHIRKYRIYIW